MKISADKVLSGAEKAQPFNILRLTDPEVYDRVPYEEFRAAAVNHKFEKEINDLLDRVVIMQQASNVNDQEIYVYFILSLSLICIRG